MRQYEQLTKNTGKGRFQRKSLTPAKKLVREGEIGRETNIGKNEEKTNTRKAQKLVIIEN